MKQFFFNKIFFSTFFLMLVFIIVFGFASAAKAAVVNTATSTSAVKDFGPSQSIVFSWTASINPGVTAVAMQVRNGTTASPVSNSDPDWSAWTTVSSGDTLSGNLSQHRYFQYRAIMTSQDISQVPSLDAVSITQTKYPATSTIISSPFDSGSTANIIPKISWVSTGTSSATVAEFQIRSAAASSSLSSAPWCGYADSGDVCAGSNYFDYTQKGKQITDMNHPLMHGGNDRYFQYRAIITSDGLSASAFDNVTVTYVVNSPPEFISAPTASQRTSDGKVVINYSALDPDTAGLGVACPNCVDASLKYSIDNGASWTIIPTQYLSTPGGANQGYGTPTIAQASTDYSVIWDAKSQASGVYASNTKIQITLNDRESGNNTAITATANFKLDVANPLGGAYPIVVNAHGAKVNEIAAHLTLDVTDDSPGLQMCVTLDASYASCVYGDYNASSSIILTADPKRVYASFVDVYKNVSNFSAITPETPNNIIIKDVSDNNLGAYQEFVVWKAGIPATFKYYHVEHSDDGISYSEFPPIDDSTINFYFDQGLAQGSDHYYRVFTEDVNRNTSFYTTVVNDTADGVGGTNPNPPIISNVQVAATTTQSATIEWDTNELANSTVHYSTDFTYDTTAGSLTMVQDAGHFGRHHVVLTNLASGQIYNFTVESQNALTVTGVDTNESNGYQFKTVSGPQISNVTANNITNNNATIVWNTDISSDSNVYYTTSTAYAEFKNAGASGESTSHEVVLSGLSKGTNYYYYVKSGVATDNKAGDYYSFATPADDVPPVITNATSTLVVDTQAVINWLTGELSDSKVVFGTQSGNYTLSSADENLATSHKIILTNLSSSTTYFYKVISVDASGNQASSTNELSFKTLQTLSEEDAVLLREQLAASAGEAAGEAAGVASGTAAGFAAGVASVTCPPVVVCAPTVVCPVCGGGGGGSSIDRTKPVLSEVSAAHISGTSAEVTWRTDKPANSLIQYWSTAPNGLGELSLDLAKDHALVLSDLIPSTAYSYKVYSIDGNGNLGQSGDLTFTTAEASVLPEATTSESAIVNDALFTATLDKAANYLLAAAGQVSVSALESSLNNQYDLIRQLSNSVPAPLLSGEPKVLTTADAATVTWSTDKKSNSLVAIAPETKYDKSKGANAYTQVVGNSTEAATLHVVTISDLQPETTYHYQVRSMSGIGALGQSNDFTFTTKSKELEISSYTIEKVNTQTAIFRWLTNNETDASVKYTPFRNGVLAVDSAEIVSNKNFSTLHEVTVDNFESGIIYEIELSGKDLKGQIISKKISSFSTGEDNFPPTIYQIQTESALSTGKDSNVQTIISWLTDEPATAQVFYQQGVGAVKDDAWEKTQIDTNYSKKHIVVLTKFLPGQIYQFKLQSADSNNNLAISKVYTILAPKQQESIFQVIIKNFEDIFGWTNKISM